MLIKYTKSVLWRVVKRLSYKEDARCLKVNVFFINKTFLHCYFQRHVSALAMSHLQVDHIFLQGKPYTISNAIVIDEIS